MNVYVYAVCAGEICMFLCAMVEIIIKQIELHVDNFPICISPVHIHTHTGTEKLFREIFDGETYFSQSMAIRITLQLTMTNGASFVWVCLCMKFSFKIAVRKQK